jgi:hypothetical protein
MTLLRVKNRGELRDLGADDLERKVCPQCGQALGLHRPEVLYRAMPDDPPWEVQLACEPFAISDTFISPGAADGPCPVDGCAGHPASVGAIVTYRGGPPSFEVVTVGPDDARNFREGMVVTWAQAGVIGPDEAAALYRRPRWYRIRRAIRGAARWALWWRRIRYETVAIDVAAGRVTQRRLRWSWRRWRWEPEDYVFKRGDPSRCIEGMEALEPLEPLDDGGIAEALHIASGKAKYRPRPEPEED